jgi:hypothetical protein
MERLGCVGDVFAAVTAGDQLNIDLLEQYGVRYVQVPNFPVSAKFNAALGICVEQERFMVLPSDDLISKEWVEFFREGSCEYATPSHCALVDVINSRSKVLTNRPTGTMSFGAGRIFSRAVVDALGGQVWSNDKNAGLDTDSHGRIVGAGFESVVHTCEKVPICDLKTDENIWAYSVWKGKDIPMNDALHMLTDEQAQCLSSLYAPPRH